MNTNQQDEIIRNNDQITIKQELAGLFQNVPVTSRLVCENLITGNIKIKKPGLHFVLPWCKKTLISVAKASFSCSFDDTLNNQEGWELTVKPVVIKFHVKPAVNKINMQNGVEIFYKEPEAMKHIKETMESLIVSIVNESKYNDLKGLEINTKKLRSKSDKNKIENTIDEKVVEIAMQFGIEIEEIKFGDVNKPKDITDAKANQERQRIENETNLEKAINEKKIAEIEAAKQKILKDLDYDALHEFLQKQNFGPDVAADIIKRHLTNSKTTIIELGLNSDALLKEALKILANTIKSKSEEKGNSDGVIDIEYEEYENYEDNRKKLP